MDEMMQKDRESKDDQKMKAPAVPKGGKKKGRKLPAVKGKAFTCKRPKKPQMPGKKPPRRSRPA